MKKKYIILITIIIIYFIFLTLIFGLDNIKNNKLEATLIIDNSSIFRLYKNKWSNINNFNNYDYQEFNVYLDNKSIGKYKLLNNNIWYLFDKNNKPINANYNSLFAYNSNYNINVKNFNYVNNSNLNIVNKILKDNNISKYNKLTCNFLYKFDIDNDSKYENIYVISNAFSKDIIDDKVFSFVVMEKDNKFIYLFNEILDNDGMNGCKPFINKIVDVDLDNNYEIILSCGRYSNEKREDYLFKFNNNKFKLLVMNK